MDMYQRLSDLVIERMSDNTDPQYKTVYLYGNQYLISKNLDALTSAFSMKHPEAKIIPIAADSFLFGMIKSIKYGISDSYPVCFRNCDLLIITDFQRVGGKEAVMEELYNILDYRLLYQKPFAISGTCSPREIPRIADRLLTILEGGQIIRTPN